MGQIKDILTETRNWAQEMRDTSGHDCIARAQFTCQIWNLNQMIKLINGIERMCHNVHNKQR
ncbi:MAG: hypothetical protein IKA25_02280 [Alphaproteobacteria bacterium]|nr:hypothetical protein [Alphaproteobacteria bacterium]MBR1953877.1 hypothetical protein [Alphaproteobacteria bacterium]